MLPLINKNTMFIESPHVVILGAGASRAAFPNGDANGNKLPLMNDFINILELEPIIRKYNYNKDITDFESFYSKIYRLPKYKKLLNTIEEKVYKYFFNLELPETITLYDYLILSLRDKDIIASFNWDPLLLKAYLRNQMIISRPKIVFLHGNTHMGACIKHKKIGILGGNCSKCNKPYEPVPLLYPVEKKDYSNNLVIKDQWNTIKKYLKNAYLLTIWGYSAPKTDVEARELLKQQWIDNRIREFTEIEIIDIKNIRELRENWSAFFVRYHYRICQSFEQSLLWNFPKQTCESFFDATLQNNPRKPQPFSQKTDSLKEVQEFIKNLKIESINRV